jgi:serine/threonine-protein kinase RsbW/stage II sporulation protein AB (anti-sigma F factor)
MRWSFPADLRAPAAAREVAREFAIARGADPDVVDAIALCVSEAVTNAVVHAYRNSARRGRVKLEAYEDDEGCLWFHVRDSGDGLSPRPDSPGLGLGLPIISQTATGMALRTPEEGGTEIVMQFHADRLARRA